MSTLKLLIADDHPVYRAGLDTVIREFRPDAQRIHCSSRDDLALCLQQGKNDPYDLLMLDLHMPGFEGVEALAYVRSQAPDLPVVVVSSSEDPEVVRACIDLGAFAFVPKSSAQAHLTQAMRSVLGGYVYLPGTSLATATPGVPPESELSGLRLTGRQTEVLQLAVMGLTNKGIAKRLSISDGTVKTHLAHLMEQFRVHTRTELVFKLAKAGFQFDVLPAQVKPGLSTQQNLSANTERCIVRR